MSGSCCWSSRRRGFWWSGTSPRTPTRPSRPAQPAADRRTRSRWPVAGGLGYLVAGRRCGRSSGCAPARPPSPRAAPASDSRSPTADDELRRLALTLNAMIDRLDAGLQRERRFVAEASHDLRTPLALMRTEVELLASRARSPREIRAALASMGEEVDRLALLVGPPAAAGDVRRGAGFGSTAPRSTSAACWPSVAAGSRRGRRRSRRRRHARPAVRGDGRPPTARPGAEQPGRQRAPATAWGQ